MPAPLLGSGWLQEKVLAVCDGYANGKVKLPDGKKLTPTVIAQIIFEKAKPDIQAQLGGKPPSSGAVNAVFDRWDDYGVVTLSTKPRAFVKWTKGVPDLAAIRADRSAARSAARPAKPAKAAAKKAPAKKAAAKKAAPKAKKAAAKAS